MSMVRTAGALAVRTVVMAACLLIMVTLLGPLTGQYRMLTILTGSMAPALAPGTVVISVPVRAEDVRPGHVITFARHDDAELTTHRVVEIQREGAELLAVTKGDANNIVDTEPVALTGQVWRQRAHVPAVGQPLVRLQTTGLARHLGLIFALLLAGAWLTRIWLPRERATQEAGEVANVEA